MGQENKNWTKEEIKEIYDMPLLELVYKAATVHREHHDPTEVQMSSLVSIKTGGCVEDCAYCPQAARYSTDVDVHKLMQVDEVVNAAKKAKSRRIFSCVFRSCLEKRA